MAPSLEWPVKRVRETFFSYFKENQHSQLSSSPVISVEDTNVPLIHTSLNQFKRTLDGPVPPDSKRCTCFSLRCIRATADKDVLDHYGKDSSYHRLTELLSSWSLDDYFKEEAIRLSWNLLTQKYNLSGDRIYVTYFGGDTTSDLSPDYDSRNIWMEYLPDRRILPSSCKASFWKAGDTGPCGPCVRIFFDGAKKKHGTTAVNINDERFVEISHLVFVQSNIQADGVVGSIQVKHAISSINVECITTILQKKKNIYETNVFAGILEVIRYGTGNEIPNYTGKVGPDDMDRVDWAYRLIADHLRMISAATAPHSQLGTKGREYFLTCADRLAVEFGHRVLNTKQERYDIVINTAIRSACLWPVEERIEEIILDEVKIYKKTLVEVLEAKRKNKSKQKQKPGNKNIASNVQSTSKPNVESSAIVWYRTRIVEFLDRRTPIILKDKHTHCSIVALCNALLLGGKIILGLGASRLSQDNLIHLIHKHLLYGNVHMQLQHNLELSDFQKEVLDVLPHLPGTLYFDLTFASIDGFVRTPTTTLFEFLGVPIYHSWLVDPQDADLYKAISTSSYLQHSLRVAVCISLCEISKSGVKKRGDLEEAGSLFKAMVSTMDGAEVHDSSNSTSGSLEMILVFLQGSQFTRHGFHSLLNNLKKNEPGLLLWNEHLITITKVDQQIYVLVNDLVVRTNVLWEEIVEVNLGGLFVDCNFTSADSKLTESMLPLTTNEIKMNQRMKKSMGLKVSAEGSQMNSGCTPAPFDLDAAPLPITLDTVYSVRPVDFFNLSTYVILQDSNGPCPIIALCNVLLLKRKITVEPDAGKVSMDYLVSLILPLLEGSKKMKVPPYSHMKMEILDLLPTLVKGLDVNILFNRTDGFSITPEYMLFDCLDVCLYHGWIINEEELDADVSAHSFESLTLAVKDPNFPNAEIIKKFIEGPQLTARGLICLHKDVPENMPCVLYWNNHYLTIIKFEGALYILVTDIGYMDTSIVWQTLNEVNGGGSYMNSRFTPFDFELSAAPSEEDNLQIPIPSSSPPIPLELPKPQAPYITLGQFVKLEGNNLSEPRTLFALGTSLTVVDTTRAGRVIGLDILKSMIFAHANGNSWDGQFNLDNIFVIGESCAEIWAPFCGKCTEDTMLNDYLRYVSLIIELFRIAGLGLPAFFPYLARRLKGSAPRCRLHSFWDCALTTLALKSSMTRAGLFNGLHRIRRLAPFRVRNALKAVFMSHILKDDWRSLIVHPVLQKVMCHNPQAKDSDKTDTQSTKDGDKKEATSKDGDDKESNRKKYGLFTRDLDSLSIYPRQVNEHGRPKREEQEVEDVEEVFQSLSELDLLYSHSLEEVLPLVVEVLVDPNYMTEELWKWLKEVLYEYDKPEAISRAPWDRDNFAWRRKHGH